VSHVLHLYCIGTSLQYPLPDGTPVPTPKETLGTLIEVTSNSTSPLPADSDIFWWVQLQLMQLNMLSYT
jgi:hypothetical protein